jgi:hypothetical protein
MESSFLKEIDALIARCWDELKEAADKKDAPALPPLNSKMAEITRMKKDHLAALARLQELLTKPTSANGPPDLRLIKIKVTQGMIDQSLLTLTEARARGLVTRFETFHITPQPGGQPFDTQLMRTGNRLQERSAIRVFYQEAGVEAGDIIELAETASGKWELRCAPVDLDELLK